MTAGKRERPEKHERAPRKIAKPSSEPRASARGIETSATRGLRKAKEARAQRGTAPLRTDKLAERIREEVSLILMSGELHDPAIAQASLVRVDVTKDLGIAKLYVRRLDVSVSEDNQKRLLRGLTRALPVLRRELASRLGIMRVPELRVFWDEDHEKRTNIERLLLEIAEEDRNKLAKS